MVGQLIQQQFSLSTPVWKLGRLAQISLLGVNVLIYSVTGMAVANSLFVSDVGGDQLPLAFIFIGLFSMPAYVLFAQVVDRYSRPQLFRYVLLISIAITLGLRFLLTLDMAVAYYILLIVIFFQWDFHNDVLYPSLLTDYFTTLEYKRFAPVLGAAQAVGMLLGGGLTMVLTQYFSTPDVLLSLPVLYAIGMAQLLWLENSQRQTNPAGGEEHAGLIESLRTFPDLVQRYPLALCLAASSFLLVIIYTSSEFLWFNIYGESFSDRALASFLGLMRVVISIIQIAAIYGFTRPLLRWLGVTRMNTVYPLTTLASFLGLAVNFNLPAAIGLHINGDALYKAINMPVHQLNYNAIPHEFIGRIRTLSDGFIYAIGLTLAGGILWVGHQFLSLVQITWLMTGLTVLLLLVRWPMGRFYAQGLEDMIRSNAINLDDFSDYRVQLPQESSQAIRELLRDRDHYTQIQGLELAANLGQPSQFMPEIEALLPGADSQLRDAVVHLYSAHPDDKALQRFEHLLQHADATVRATALEVLVVNQEPPTTPQLQSLLADDRQEIRVLAAVAEAQATSDDAAQGPNIPEPDWPDGLTEATTKTLARVIIHGQNRQVVPVLQTILPAGSAETKRAGLTALAQLAEPGDRPFAEMAVPDLSHPDPLVRMAAVHLVGATRSQESLSQVAPLLGDPDPRVRQGTANVLASFGEEGITLAQEGLSDPRPEVTRSAIAAIGQVRTQKASNILYNYLVPEFQHLAHTRRWQKQIPPADPNWQPLAVAIADYHQRLIQQVLYVLSCLGHSRTVNTVTQMMATTDQGSLENAVEVLTSLSHQRFVLPLIPLLEQTLNPTAPKSRIKPTSQWLRTKGYRVLLEALESRDRWIRAGALTALAVVPSALINDSDPLVRFVAQQIFPQTGQQSSPTDTVMNQLLLLKNVALFKNLSLDELLLIDQAIEQEQVFANETIFTEGSWGTHLYIIAEGQVRLVKEIDGEPQEVQRLSKGQYFGEVALFDDAPRWDGAIAIEDCTLLKLEKNRFLSLITQRPHIILEICRFLSQRLRETDKYRSARKLPTTETSAMITDGSPLEGLET